MKRLRPLLPLLLAFNLALVSGCIVVPDPITEKIQKEVVCGVRPETGEQLIVRAMFRPYLYSLTPIGRLDGNRWTEYSLRRGSSEIRLPFLDQQSRRSNREESPDLMWEMLPIRGTPLWAAFARRGMNRYIINLKMIVFDNDGIHSMHEIKGAIRHFSLEPRLAGYSVGVDSVTGRITIMTESGEQFFDPLKGRLVPVTNRTTR